MDRMVNEALRAAQLALKPLGGSQTAMRLLYSHARTMESLRPLLELDNPTVRLLCEEVPALARASQQLEIGELVRGLPGVSVLGREMETFLASPIVADIGRALCEDTAKRISDAVRFIEPVLTTFTSMSGLSKDVETFLTIPRLSDAEDMLGVAEQTDHAARITMPLTPCFDAGRTTVTSPAMPNYQAEIVVEIRALRYDVAYLSRDVQDVRDSAARDARKHRKQAVIARQEERRIKLWHLILTLILTAILAKLLGG